MQMILRMDFAWEDDDDEPLRWLRGQWWDINAHSVCLLSLLFRWPTISGCCVVRAVFILLKSPLAKSMFFAIKCENKCLSLIPSIDLSARVDTRPSKKERVHSLFQHFSRLWSLYLIGGRRVLCCPFRPCERVCIFTRYHSALMCLDEWLNTLYDWLNGKWIERFSLSVSVALVIQYPSFQTDRLSVGLTDTHTYIHELTPPFTHLTVSLWVYGKSRTQSKVVRMKRRPTNRFGVKSVSS